MVNEAVSVVAMGSRTTHTTMIATTAGMTGTTKDLTTGVALRRAMIAGMMMTMIVEIVTTICRTMTAARREMITESTVVGIKDTTDIRIVVVSTGRLLNMLQVGLEDQKKSPLEVRQGWLVRAFRGSDHLCKEYQIKSLLD